MNFTQVVSALNLGTMSILAIITGYWTVYHAVLRLFPVVSEPPIKHPHIEIDAISDQESSIDME